MFAIFMTAGTAAATAVITPTVVLNSSCCVTKRNARLPTSRARKGHRIESHALAVASSSSAATSVRENDDRTNRRKVSFISTKYGSRRTSPRAMSRRSVVFAL